MAKTVPACQEAELSPLEVECPENVQPNLQRVGRLGLVEPETTLEPERLLRKRKNQQMGAKPDTDVCDSDWTTRRENQIRRKSKRTTTSPRREFADEFGESDKECVSGEKEREERARRPAQQKRLMKRVRAEEGESHAEHPPLVMPSDRHAASSQVSARSRCSPNHGRATAPQSCREDLSYGDESIWCEACEDWFKDSCPTCNTLQADNEGFSQAGDLVKTKIGKKRHQCGICGKVFKWPSLLVRHEQTHTGHKPYQCHKCGKTFRTSSGLTRHERRTHTGEKLYRCGKCGKTFSESSYLAEHKRTHTGEKPPYQCGICCKAFWYSDSLRKHERRTHTCTGEKPYRCDMCGKTFNQAPHLAVHERTHTGEKPFQCDICGKSFSQRPHLVTHERTHIGEKPYQCGICGKAFSQAHYVVIHERTHTGEKPYQCDKCGKAFRFSCQLKKHLKTHCWDTPLNYCLLINVQIKRRLEDQQHSHLWYVCIHHHLLPTHYCALYTLLFQSILFSECLYPTFFNLFLVSEEALFYLYSV